MAKQTKKLSAQPTVTTVNSGQKLPMVDGSGNVTLITLDNLKAGMIGTVNLNAIEDGIFIMFHRKSDDLPLMATSDTSIDMTPCFSASSGFRLRRLNSTLPSALTK